jgi:hypothetical protein
MIVIKKTHIEMLVLNFLVLVNILCCFTMFLTIITILVI